MKLTLLEKVLLPQILPQEGNIKSLIILKDLRKKIELTQDDIKDYSIEVLDNGSVKWNEAGVNAEFEIEFTELEKEEVKRIISKLDKEEKLPSSLLNLAQLFEVGN